MRQQPTPAQHDVLPVWRDHRGDGPVAVFPAAAATDAELAQAMQGSHDLLIEQTGALRAGPIQWFRFGPSQPESRNAGIALCEAIGYELEPDLLLFLRDNQDSTLVLAMVATDRISRRTPPRSARGRRR